MTYCYLDTSVAARILLGQSPEAQRWFDAVTASSDDMVISSRVLRTELTRVLRREDRDVAERDQLLDFIGTIPFDTSILTDAEAIVPKVRTLDAIHLASAIRAGVDDLVMVTHDSRLGQVAKIIGMDVMDPVTDDPGRGPITG